MFEEVVVLYVQLDVFASTDGRKKGRNGSAVVVVDLRLVFRKMGGGHVER